MTVWVNVVIEWGIKFLCLVSIVTSHECAHVVVARCFGVETARLIFTPFGEVAVMKDLPFLEPKRKALVLLAGPMTNVVMGLFCLCVFEGQFVFFRNACFAIGLFNLLPVYPLDGGRLMHLCLRPMFGVLGSNRLTFLVGRVCACLLIGLGFVQVVFFPFNVSLLCMGLFTRCNNEKEYMETIIRFHTQYYLKDGQNKHLS